MEKPATRVAITRCDDYDNARVQAAVKESLALIGGLTDIIKPGDRVLLKANLLAPVDPKESVTTHPAVVRAVIELVREAGGIPIVADSPGYFYAGGKCRALTMCGLKDVADEMGAESTQFEAMENGFVETEVPDGVYLSRIFAARLALEADVIVTLPKLKTHASTWYTGAVKNMFGAVATHTRKEAHKLATYERFSGSVVDIFSVLRPHLAIMDAVVGMEGEGPRHGSPRQTGLIIASKDAVALDAVASKIIGFDPMEVFTTKDATARGLGNGIIEEIDIRGERMADVAVDYEKPSGKRVNMHPWMMKVGYRFVRVRPECLVEKCDKCGICAKSCPVDAIEMNPYPDIDREKCIECFCCNEMCPTAAMEIGKNWLARRLA
ncbi:MAG: DUF362 domain-containing protein [Thermoleophilia bacterium]|jgi:uncharacterized protein (DUF362 family)/Pyruvate/2-oxoacid:ferredoxin oxidoreductase delta subunit